MGVTQRLPSLNRCGSVTYISWSSDFALYLEDYWMVEGHTWYNGSVWHKDWPHKIYIGQWPILAYILCQWFYLLFWRIFDWRTSYFGLMDQCDTNIDLISYMQVNDLYFAVQWFCLISWLCTVNYFDKLNNGTSQVYSCPSGHLL